jgi:hypothetical protein
MAAAARWVSDDFSGPPETGQCFALPALRLLCQQILTSSAWYPATRCRIHEALQA